ncbi:MAG: hypothetical protein RLZZ225_1195 [Pseudomonadota bacterium]|jgi:hypothetical protein
MSKKSREKPIYTLEEVKNVNYSQHAPQSLKKILEQGQKEGRYEVAQNLLAIGMPLGLVKEVTKLPELKNTTKSG